VGVDKDIVTLINELAQAGFIGYIAYEGTSECLDVYDIQNWNVKNVILLTVATAGGVYKCFQIRVPGNLKQKSLALMLNAGSFVQGLLLRKAVTDCYSDLTSEREMGICSKYCISNNVLPLGYMVFASLSIVVGMEREMNVDIENVDIEVV
jgi:hypothetical protein